MNDLLSTALAMHQSGQLEPASRLYYKILLDEEDNATALHLLGVLHNQQGEHARAVEKMSRAVALRPNVPAFHANLAEAYRSLGQFERAAGSCRTALRLWPDFPEAHCNLGLALQGLDRHAEAAEHLMRALSLRPDFAVAHNNLGITYRETGRLEEALKHFARACELAPDYPPARTNLGQILLDLGQADAAEPHCRAAVSLQPDLAAAHHNLGNVLRVLGRRVDARSAYLEAIRLDAKLAISHAHLGQILQEDGDLDDARVWLKQAIDLEPEKPEYWEYLAELQMEREQFAEAIPCWERVLALDPKRAPACCGLGLAHHEEGRSVEAVKYYREALQWQPHLAVAQMNLGAVHEENGEVVQAEEAFRKALTLQPSFALPHGRLATLLRGKLSDDDRAALEARLADPSLADGPRTRLLFALAHVLDGRGNYCRAAECLKEANARAAAANRQRKREYVPAEHEQFVNRLVTEFGQEFFERTRGGGLETQQPVFVFGLPRSGTTLVEQVLASHSLVFGAGELRLGRQTFDAIPKRAHPDGPAAGVPALDRVAIGTLAEQHLSGLRETANADAMRIVDKMPDNYLYVGLLAAMFPKATFIHCRRDLRDIAVSCWMTDFRSIRWANDVEHLASRFQQYRRLMRHWQRVLPVHIHEVVYEEMIEDFAGESRRLLAACDLQWEEACDRFHETARPVRTASVMQVRQPLYRRAVARWRHYEAALADLFERLPGD